MGANLFGQRFQLMTFGESHGPALGAVVDGCPAGIEYREDLLLRELNRRRPGQSAITTSRQEADAPEVLSGIFEGETLGTPIATVVRNTNQRSGDYAQVAATPRAGHADDVWRQKFGHSDPRGGGRSSGRETLCRVIGGSFAQMFLNQAFPGLKVVAFTSQVADLQLSTEDRAQLEKKMSVEYVETFTARFPSSLAVAAEARILSARDGGNSLGGLAEIWIEGLPQGFGQPVFHKLKSDLASALMSLGATSGVEIGAGFGAASAEGIAFHGGKDARVYGGIRGGISTGERICVKAAFKPTSSILDVAKKGRHDPFIVPRAVPVLEAMVWLVLADHALWMRSDRI